MKIPQVFPDLVSHTYPGVQCVRNGLLGDLLH
jgi:hypothetical protein